MEDQRIRPTNDSWVAAVYDTEFSEVSLGSAFTLDQERIVTCAHVVRAAAESGTPLWVAFPKAEHNSGGRVLVNEITIPNTGLQRIQDVAILRLAAPLSLTQVPRLRCPTPADLVGRDWWAFGFPNGEVLGNSADGSVGEALAYGWVRLDTQSKYTVKSGFSGSAVWSFEYNAVVGMIGQASADGDARALSLWQIDRIFPDEGIAKLAAWRVEEAGESALASWGWSLRNDPEAGRHWRPRARGVSIDTEKGFRFRGRNAALEHIVSWIRQPTMRKALVVTGSPGVGKSAVLGRIVTTADPDIQAQLPADDNATRSPIGAVSCAVHAKSKTALDVAVEIAVAASAAIPEDVEDLPENLRDALRNRTSLNYAGTPTEAFTVVIDALDEAANPQEARSIIRRIVVPLVETCTELRLRVVVGSRRRDDAGDLLASFGRALELVDLDHPDYFDQQDLEAYTIATLQLLGDERVDNPYRDDAKAAPVAKRIASMASRNFLIAGLVARAHGLHDQEAVHPLEISFIPTVDGALRDYMGRIAPIHGCSAEFILTALAFSESPGFSLTLWQAAVSALGGPDVPEHTLGAFARSSAANFLVETGGEATNTTYRLFHQALNETLLGARGELHTRRGDERAIARALMAEGERKGWVDVDPYLKRSLAIHAESGGVLDELLSKDVYLLYADLRRLLPVIDRSASQLSRQKTKFIRRTRQAFNANPSQRIALFSVTEAQQRLGHVYGDLEMPAPYRATWSTVQPGGEEAILDGHTRWSYILCPFSVSDRQLLASAGGDRTVRVWDPVLGEVMHIMEGHTEEIRSIVPVQVGSALALASAGRDRVIKFWDPLSGDALHDIGESTFGYSALCSLNFSGRTILAASQADEESPEIQLFDPATGELLGILNGHQGWVTSLCEVESDGTSWLASSSEDGTVRFWEIATGAAKWIVSAELESWRFDTSWTRALCTLNTERGDILVGAGFDSVIRLWDPSNGREIGRLKGHNAPVLTVCTLRLNGMQLLASAGQDETVRLWDPNTQQQLSEWHCSTEATYSICALKTGSEGRLFSSGDDRLIRTWDPTTGAHQDFSDRIDMPTFDIACIVPTEKTRLMATAKVGEKGVYLKDPASWDTVQKLPTDVVHSLCVFPLKGKPHLAVGMWQIELWDPSTCYRAAILEHPRARYTAINSMFAARIGDSPILVGSLGSSIHIWDVVSENPIHGFEVGGSGAREVCPVPFKGNLAIAGLSFDGAVRVWDLRSGQQLRELRPERGSFTAYCTVRVGSRVLLAVGTDSGSIQLWDVTDQRIVHSLDGHSSRVRQIWVSVVAGRKVLMSAAEHRVVRAWDAESACPLLDIPLHYTITWAAQCGADLTVALDTGLTGIKINLSNVNRD
ncbi:trypsin-like peptidase domain-containing protein [Streptomyces sp. NPDC019990]|uniref:trypsin-like peptidase domain-containing protein n=1 Tax=Streptomyces sp. NPDC019990 TaxID=3154693 RepID=UPI0033F9F597